ncbi:hypothetical protein HWV62_41741 [Athelia sp. TMB]|nr:hypothetical protein HWV62_41741 [Athelia sp. TMB]
MAETLLAILLVTSTAAGSNLVFRWPPAPAPSARLARPRPDHKTGAFQLDNPGRAASFSETDKEHPAEPPNSLDSDEDYEWVRPNTLRDRSMSFSRPAPGQQSGRKPPSEDVAYDTEEPAAVEEFDPLFGYSSEFLAGLLCPRRSLCHQKFELIVDDLAFIGHPVCAEDDEVWRFKPERLKSGSRGRGSRNRQLSQLDEADDRDTASGGEQRASSSPARLQKFHLVIALDLPDPSSSASGNVAKYFDIIYEQIAFTVAAVLFQEQVLSNFVEKECEILASLKDEYASNCETLENYMAHALRESSIAPAMKTLYEAIKSSTMAHITIHNIPMELQLPPYLDHLLHTEDDYHLDFVDRQEDDDGGETNAWDKDMGFGWRLPALAPWKSLLLLDNQNEQNLDPQMGLSGSQAGSGDRALAEGLIKFLETASVTLSLYDMASLLDWDLETQVYPIVRWLVLHRRAKIVDTVHNGLKTVFTIAPKFESPLSDLIKDFKRDFPQPNVLPLTRILSTLSTSTSKQSDNHFFAAVVKSKDLVSLYHEVVLWMLKRDLLITLHLRIRVVATEEIKQHVRMQRDMQRSKRSRRRLSSFGMNSDAFSYESDIHGKLTPVGRLSWLSLSPKSARRQTRQLPSVGSGYSRTGQSILEDDSDDGFEYGDDDEREADDSDEAGIGWSTEEDILTPTMISDPGRATPLQRKWLSAMSEDKEEHIAKRFDQINQYFDGKRTDDEILHRAEITRKQLREVLHHYEEYLQTFLHPS